VKVKDLIIMLESLNPEDDVILAGDSEGNYFSEGVDIERGVYENGTFYSLEWSADDACLEQEEWDKMKAGQQCVVIWP